MPASAIVIESVRARCSMPAASVSQVIPDVQMNAKPTPNTTRQAIRAR